MAIFTIFQTKKRQRFPAMTSLNTPYEKLNESDQERVISLWKTRRRITIVGLSSIFLLVVIVANVIGVFHSKKGNSENQSISSSSSIKAICNVTLYPDLCYNSLFPLVKFGNFQPNDIFELSVQVAINELTKISNDILENGLEKFNISDKMTLAAIESCQELLSLSLDHLNKSLSLKEMKFLKAFDDLRT